MFSFVLLTFIYIEIFDYISIMSSSTEFFKFIESLKKYSGPRITIFMIHQKKGDVVVIPPMMPHTVNAVSIIGSRSP